MSKNIDDVWERLHWIALWTWNISRSLDSLEVSLNRNTENLINALNKNSKSASFLARVWIWIWFIWAIATWIWAYYTYLSYFK